MPVAEGPPIVPVYSRWKAGPMSMGPVGRISWTVGVLLIAAFAAFSADIFFIGIWCLFVGPMILRSVWKSHRII